MMFRLMMIMIGLATLSPNPNSLLADCCCPGGRGSSLISGAGGAASLAGAAGLAGAPGLSGLPGGILSYAFVYETIPTGGPAVVVAPGLGTLSDIPFNNVGAISPDGSYTFSGGVLTINTPGVYVARYDVTVPSTVSITPAFQLFLGNTAIPGTDRGLGLVTAQGAEYVGQGIFTVTTTPVTLTIRPIGTSTVTLLSPSGGATTEASLTVYKLSN